MTILHSYDFSP